MYLSYDDKKEIEDITKLLYKRLVNDFGDIDFKNPFKVISLIEGYIIIRYPLDDNCFKSSKESLSGFSTNIDNYNCIYINSSHVLGRQHFSCWHEFYHCIDDINDNCRLSEAEYIIRERKADYFALSMLLPRQKIDDYFFQLKKKYNDLNLDDLIIMQNTFRVSFASLLRRLKELYNIDYYYYSGISSIKRIDEFRTKTKELGFDIDLITSTNDTVLPMKFIDSIVSTIQKNRIDINKADFILNILEDKEVKFLW